jgi:hypothetical protein
MKVSNGNMALEKEKVVAVMELESEWEWRWSCRAYQIDIAEHVVARGVDDHHRPNLERSECESMQGRQQATDKETAD